VLLSLFLSGSIISVVLVAEDLRHQRNTSPSHMVKSGSPLHISFVALGCHVSVAAIKFRTDSEFEPNLNPNLNSDSNEGAYAQSSLNGEVSFLHATIEPLTEIRASQVTR
jgi:hypothetical protein